jgi:hypothetical protein
LIARTHVVTLETAGDVQRLAAESDDDVDGLRIKAPAGIGMANVAQHIPGNGNRVNLGLCGDFAEDEEEVAFDGAFNIAIVPQWHGGALLRGMPHRDPERRAG